MLEKLHRKLLKKNSAYARWHKNPLHSFVHFAILAVILACCAFYIQTGIEHGLYYRLLADASYNRAALEYFAQPFGLQDEFQLLSAGYLILFFIVVLLAIFTVTVFLLFR